MMTRDAKRRWREEKCFSFRAQQDLYIIGVLLSLTQIAAASGHTTSVILTKKYINACGDVVKYLLRK